MEGVGRPGAGCSAVWSSGQEGGGLVHHDAVRVPAAGQQLPSPPIEGNSTTRTGQRSWRRQRPLVCTQVWVQAATAPRFADGEWRFQGCAWAEVGPGLGPAAGGRRCAAGCSDICRTVVGAARVEDGVARRRRRLMVLGIGLRLLDLDQVRVVDLLSAVVLAPVATTRRGCSACLLGCRRGWWGRTDRTDGGHKEASCG
jgi:hypothetical protein